MKIAVLGVGLIGGSIGLAARGLGHTVAGAGRDAGRLARARELGAIDVAADSVAAAVADAEAVFCCAPVGALGDQIAAALAAAPEECVVTDVGSIKGGIVEAAGDPRFVGGPPDRRRRDRRGRARPRRSLPGRRLVPDALRAVGGDPLRAPAPPDRVVRRAPQRHRSGRPRPVAGHGQPSTARARQRPRGSGREWRRGGAPGRAELPRRHARRRRELGHLDGHLPRQRRPDRRRGGGRRSPAERGRGTAALRRRGSDHRMERRRCRGPPGAARGGPRRRSRPRAADDRAKPPRYRRAGGARPRKSRCEHRRPLAGSGA